MVKDWTLDQLPDLTGRNYLITGSNTGVGFRTARHLRRANANVLITARSPEKGEDARLRLDEIDSDARVELVDLDLADLSSIRAAAATVRDRVDGLDAVVNNAGIMQTPQRRTAEDFELQFGTNHLGHFLLNHLLFDLVVARNGRIVPVSSIVAMRAKAIDFDDPMLSASYSPERAYYQSKLANLTYGLELARRLESAGSAVASISCHPGYSATNLQSTGPTGIRKAVYKITNLFAQPASAGAVPEVLAAAGIEAVNGGYYGPTGPAEARGPVGEARINPAAADPDAGRRLWELSEQLLDVQWEIG